MNSIQCTRCGLINSITDNVCIRCQAPLTPSAAMSQSQQQPPPPQYPPQQSPPPQAMQGYIKYPPPAPYPGAPAANFAPMQCPYCHSQAIMIDRKVSVGGWIVFAALLVVCLPLCWLGLFIKEDVRVCTTCRARLG